MSNSHLAHGSNNSRQQRLFHILHTDLQQIRDTFQFVAWTNGGDRFAIVFFAIKFNVAQKQNNGDHFPNAFRGFVVKIQGFECALNPESTENKCKQNLVRKCVSHFDRQCTRFRAILD